MPQVNINSPVVRKDRLAKIKTRSNIRSCAEPATVEGRGRQTTCAAYWATHQQDGIPPSGAEWPLDQF
jgi:hypothetical protein